MNKPNLKQKLIDFLLSHKFIFTIISIAIALLLIFILPKFIDNVDYNIENVQYMAQIVAAVYLIIGTVIAVFQYYSSSRSSLVEIQTHNVEKAIELAEFYKNEVLLRHAVISYVFEKSGITAILKTMDSKRIKNFDKTELRELLSEENIAKLKEIQNSPQFIKAIVEVNIIHKLDFNEEIIVTLSKYDEQSSSDSEDGKLILTTAPSLLNTFFTKYIATTLNNLELFSMYFNHNVADSSVIYQSLHQTYISIVELLYYNISNNNDKGYEKFYTNTIELYNEWKSEVNKHKMSEIDHTRNNYNKGTIVDKINV